jgi:hypothetical protein
MSVQIRFLGEGLWLLPEIVEHGCNLPKPSCELTSRETLKRARSTSGTILEGGYRLVTLDLLPTKNVQARLMNVRLAAKVGVSIMGLLLAALPVMACTIPGTAMTKAEHDCCKKMAEQCGRSRMAKSHGCCQTQATPNDSKVLKASSFQLEHSLVDLHALPATLRAADDLQLTVASSFPSPTHSPPGLLASATTVLRI